MSGKAWRETFAALGVIGSLVFVGWEIRSNTVQARAEAYLEIGFQLSEMHADLAADPELARLSHEVFIPEEFYQWSLLEWQRWVRTRVVSLRITETVQLQVDQGLLEAEDMDRLGGFLGGHTLVPGNACIWPVLRQDVSPALLALIEESYPPVFECEATPALDSLMTPVLRDPPPP